MVYVRICDNDLTEGNRIKELVVSELDKRKIASKCNLFTNGEDLLKAEAKSEELIFLNTELSGISGIEVGKRLKDLGRNRNTILLANCDEITFSVLESFPFHLMRKSRIEDEIGEVIEQYVRQYCKGKPFLLYKTRSERSCIPAHAIRYIKYFKHKLTVKLEDGEERTFRGTIKECEDQLKGAQFIKVNSGTLVNLEYCEAFHTEGFLVKGETISVSREKKREAEARFSRYWKEKADDIAYDQ